MLHLIFNVKKEYLKEHLGTVIEKYCLDNNFPIRRTYELPTHQNYFSIIRFDNEQEVALFLLLFSDKIDVLDVSTKYFNINFVTLLSDTGLKPSLLTYKIYFWSTSNVPDRTNVNNYLISNTYNNIKLYLRRGKTNIITFDDYDEFKNTKKFMKHNYYLHITKSG
jgi:hypothetical protein